MGSSNVALSQTEYRSMLATKQNGAGADRDLLEHAVVAAAGDSVFDEPLERLWVEQWLFYANSTRFASAMAGTDYGVFANGRFFLAKNLREMAALLELLTGE